MKRNKPNKKSVKKNVPKKKTYNHPPKKKSIPKKQAQKQTPKKKVPPKKLPAKKITPPVKKSYKLYFKGKPITDRFKETVIKIASVKKVLVNTPKRLHDFYEKNKPGFTILFNMGLETIPTSTNKVFSDFDKAEQNGNDFFIEKGGVIKPVTEVQAKFELAKLEQELNVRFDSTGMEYSYKIKLDNTITIVIPTNKELNELEGEDIEVVIDYLAEFGINIYVSNKKRNKNYKDNEPYRNKYNARISDRLKKYRKQHREEVKQHQKRSKKNKAKGRKR